MMPLRRGRGGREKAPEDAAEAPTEGAEERAEAATQAVEKDGEREQGTRARETARAERRAHKEAARADKQERRRRAKRRRAERRAKRREKRRDREEKAKEPERPKAMKPEKAKAREPTKPKAKKPEKAKTKKPAKAKKPEKPKAKKPEKARPRRERAGAGVALRRAGSRANAALTGPRARRAAARVDGGIQSAWKLLVAGLATLLAGTFIIARFVAGGLRELWSLWLRAAEALGNAILWVERRVRPVVLAALRGARRGLRVAEREVTPRRALAFVVIAAAAALAASQFVDYRGVRIGAPAYAGVEAVAPAPQTDRQTTGSVHGYAMVPVAAVVVGAALLALAGRWRIARVIPLLAAGAIAVTLLLDARRGLDEGDAAIAYQGAQAVLIEGFWLQLASAAVLLVTGVLLTRYARPEAAPAGRRRRTGDGSDRPGRRRRFRIAGVRA
jgi:hypothetical protein